MGSADMPAPSLNCHLVAGISTGCSRERWEMATLLALLGQQLHLDPPLPELFPFRWVITITIMKLGTGVIVYSFPSSLLILFLYSVLSFEL